MNTLKCKVVILPYNQQVKPGFILTKNLEGKLWYGRVDQPEFYAPYPQHLYLTSNREIQSGDWFLNITKSTIHKATIINQNIQSGLNHGEYHGKFECQKIKATTDKSLNLPLIPNSFIEKYVQVQGKIDEVLIEIYGGSAQHPKGILEGTHVIGVKTRADGTVIIHRLKDSWTWEELKEACWRAFQEGASGDGGYMIDQQERDFEVWFLTNY